MYEIFWEEIGCFDYHGEFETLEEAIVNLHSDYDLELNTAATDNMNIEIKWDDDGLGFLAMLWTGPNKDTADDYFERSYRIREA